MKKNSKIKERRETLKKISQTVKELVNEGEFDSVNQAIVEAIYKEQNPDIQELNTFGNWKKKGFSIKKGEKAKLVWGQPRRVEQDGENDEYKFWPVCYLFDNTQVIKRGGEHGRS